MIDLPSLAAGFDFPRQTIMLDTEAVSAYVRAVEDPYAGYAAPHGVVPPLAVLALAMRGLAGLLEHYPGVLHLTQQLTSLRPIPIGSTVISCLSERSRSERRGFAALALDARIMSGDDCVLDGGLLLMVPLREGTNTHD